MCPYESFDWLGHAEKQTGAKQPKYLWLYMYAVRDEISELKVGKIVFQFSVCIIISISCGYCMRDLRSTCVD